MKEVFRDIPGYIGYYQASNLGRIRRTNTGKILKQKTEKLGYMRVCLSKEGNVLSHTVHRLVLLSFLGDSNLVCNHKNGIRNDNKLDNLEYCTQKYNVKHGYINGRVPYNKGVYGISPNAKEIKQITKSGVIVKVWSSTLEIGRELGFDPSSIIKCCKGKLNTSSGYIWEYNI